MSDDSEQMALATTFYRDPAYVERELSIIWDRAGQPFGLLIDGWSYRVRHSPRLACRSGDRVQVIFERVPFDPNRAEDTPPAA